MNISQIDSIITLNEYTNPAYQHYLLLQAKDCGLFKWDNCDENSSCRNATYGHFDI